MMDNIEAFKARVGKNLGELREAREWTQADLAREAGITRQAVANYEEGKQVMSLYVAVKITKALKARSITVLTK
tara:strand:+ start:329 stop:550 length:222 start_codon:yes stop_codon:yes gene_type:complete